MSKIVRTAAGVAGEPQATTLVDKIVAAPTSLLKIFSKEEGDVTYLSEKDVGVVALTAFAGGFLVGDRWGDRVPFLGGHRQ